MESSRKLSNNPAVPGKTSPSFAQNQQGMATLIVMIAVLVIIVLFCCFAAPGIRGLCKRYIFRTCDIDDPDLDNASRFTEEASPTVILLPNGRMLVVDRRVLRHSHFDLSNVCGPLGSTPSILDSSETSKGVSPTSLGYPPPNYDDVFPRLLDLPPSYSEISLMARKFEAMEMTNLDGNSEAIDSVASEAAAVVEAVGMGASNGRGEPVREVAASDRSFEVIEMTDFDGEARCVIDTTSDRNTVIVFGNDNDVVDTCRNSNGHAEDNVNRTNNTDF